MAARVASVLMFLPERVAAPARATREIYRRAEEGKLHFVETESGDLLISLRSEGVKEWNRSQTRAKWSA